MNILLAFGIFLLIVGLVILIGLPLFDALGKKEPEVTRKWTDPAGLDETFKRK